MTEERTFRLGNPLVLSMYLGIFVYFSFENFHTITAYVMALLTWPALVFMVMVFFIRLGEPRRAKRDLEDLHRIRYGIGEGNRSIASVVYAVDWFMSFVLSPKKTT